jgi:DNA-damage-inducible protein J
MANNLSNVSFRIDSNLKSQAERLFSELGLNLTTAFNIFLRQSVREGSIPFQVTVNTPNADTVAAMLEAERISRDPGVRGYRDVDALFEDLRK